MTTHAHVFEPRAPDGVGITDTSSVEENWSLHKMAQARQVQLPKFVPFRKYEKRLRPLGCSVRRGAISQPSWLLWEYELGVAHRFGIVQAENGSLSQKSLDDSQARSVTNVIGARLEGQAQDADRLSPNDPKRALQLSEEETNAAAIDPLNFLQQREIHAMFLGKVDEGSKILRKAVAAEADTWREKMGADSRIQAERVRHVVDVSVHGLAQVSHHVDEGNLGRQEGVCCVLDEFCRVEGRHHELAVQGAVELLKDLPRFFRLDSEDNPVGVEKVF